MDYRTGRTDARSGEKPLQHAERWHPGSQGSFLEKQALHLREISADKVQVSCSFLPTMNEKHSFRY